MISTICVQNRVATVILSLFLAQICSAYDSSNKLVDYNDYIVIKDNLDPSAEDYTMELFSFPYITNVSRNKLLF
jgi:hypothetical protein